MKTGINNAEGQNDIEVLNMRCDDRGYNTLLAIAIPEGEPESVSIIMARAPAFSTNPVSNLFVHLILNRQESDVLFDSLLELRKRQYANDQKAANAAG